MPAALPTAFKERYSRGREMGSILELPFVSTVYNLMPHVDYEGQKFAEKLFKYILLLFAVVGFVWGYVCQQFSQTVYVFGAGFLLACLLVLPPWPMFRKHPLQWLPSKDAKQTGSGTATTSSATGGSKANKNESTKQTKQEAKKRK